MRGRDVVNATLDFLCAAFLHRCLGFSFRDGARASCPWSTTAGEKAPQVSSTVRTEVLSFVRGYVDAENRADVTALSMR
jgi:hypothetical protein